MQQRVENVELNRGDETLCRAASREDEEGERMRRAASQHKESMEEYLAQPLPG